MKESVAVAKEADAKKGVSPTKSSDNSIHRVRDEPEMQLGSLRDVIGNIRRDGGTPSVESIATELSGMHTAQRASVLLALQQTHGNRYVQRVVSGIQAKLVVGQPGDAYEQEADRVADQVMRMPEPQVQCQEEEEELIQTKLLAEQITPVVQRQVEEEEEEFLQAKSRDGASPEVAHDLESEINAIRGGGRSLSGSERAYFEPRFGYDFSRVRVHTNDRAMASARALNARAYTIGSNVVFGTGQYMPGSIQGRQLLAHELTHVVQQSEIGTHTQLIQLTPTEDFFRELRAEEDPQTSLRVRLIQVIHSLQLSDLPEAEGLFQRLQNSSDELGQYFRERLVLQATQQAVLEQLATALASLRQGLPAPPQRMGGGERPVIRVGSPEHNIEQTCLQILRDWHEGAIQGANRVARDLLAQNAADEWSGFIRDLIGNTVWAAAAFTVLLPPTALPAAIAVTAFSISMAGIAINMSDDVPTDPNEMSESVISRLFHAYINAFYGNMQDKAREWSVRYVNLNPDNLPSVDQISRDFMVECCGFPAGIRRGTRPAGHLTVDVEAVATLQHQAGSQRLQNYREQIPRIGRASATHAFGQAGVGVGVQTTVSLVLVQGPDQLLRLARVRFPAIINRPVFETYITRDMATAALARWRGVSQGAAVPPVFLHGRINWEGRTPSIPTNVATASIQEIEVGESLGVP
jgi:hypothetical protein